MKQASCLGLLSKTLAVTVLTSAFLTPGIAVGQSPSTQSPDNSAQNTPHAMTADQQSNGTSDRLLTQKIRKAIIADKSLSMYGHNVKIITKDGSVTLKGPVHSDEEKQSIGAKAAEAAGGADKITNQLTIKQ